MFKNMRLVQKIVLPVGLVLIITLGALAWIIQSQGSKTVREVAEKELAALAGQYGNLVKGFVEVSINESNALAHILTTSVQDSSGLTREMVLEMLKGIAEHNDLIVGAGTIWETNAFDGKDSEYVNVGTYGPSGHFSAYASFRGGRLDVSELDSSSEYYQRSKRERMATVTGPFEYPIDGKTVLMITGSSPVIINGSFKGMACTDITLEVLSDMITKVKVYDTGFGVLLTREGLVVAHPDASRVNKPFDMTSVGNPQGLKAALLAGNPFLDRRTVNGEEMLCYYQPITFEGTTQVWYVLINAPLEKILGPATTLSRLSVGICVGVLVLVLIVLVLIAKSTAKPIVYLAGVAEKIADGKLDTPINDSGFGGEVGQLGRSLKTMIASLLKSLADAEAMKADAERQAEKAREAMGKAEAASREAEAKSEAMLKAADKLEEVANIVSSASTELSAQIEQSERGASEQAARVGETATAMEQMNSTVLEVAKNAGTTSDVSAHTREKAIDGANIVRKAVDSIQDVQRQSMALKEDMTVLTEHAAAISRIMGVISDIADQTNLLALNAAIEAARAGEAGRGFAVVADEVRKLAEKTMASTTDVGNAIKAIQESADKSRDQVDHAVKTIEDATEFAQRSGMALDEIVNMVDSTADQIRAIATASEEQSASSEEISQSISQISSIAEETARAMEEAARAVSDLSSQAQTLASLIEDMKRG